MNQSINFLFIPHPSSLCPSSSLHHLFFPPLTNASVGKKMPSRFVLNHWPHKPRFLPCPTRHLTARRCSLVGAESSVFSPTVGDRLWS